MKILVQNYPFASVWKMKSSIIRTAASPSKIANFLKVKYSRSRRSGKAAGMPINILIEPTRTCNYACLMCPRETIGVPKKLENQTMSIEQFKKIMDEIGKYLTTVRFWHFGEPLLAPDFFKMVKYAKKKRIFTATASNLATLTPQKADEMIDSGLDYLLVNFNGATKETYEKYAGREKTFEKVLENIACLVKRKKEKKSWHPFIDLQFIIMRENEQEIEKMKQLAAGLGVDKLAFKLVLTLTEKSRNEVEPENAKFKFDVSQKNMENRTCCLPWEECVINSAGEVSVCAADPLNKLPMGNVFKQSFASIWNCEKYQSFRKDVAKDIDSVKICFHCGKRNNPEFFVNP